MLRMEQPGKRKRGGLNRYIWMRRERGMAVAEVTKEGAQDRTKWRWKIRRGDPWREKPKEEEDTRVSWIYTLFTPLKFAFHTSCSMRIPVAVNRASCSSAISRLRGARAYNIRVAPSPPTWNICHFNGCKRNSGGKR